MIKLGKILIITDEDVKKHIPLPYEEDPYLFLKIRKCISSSDWKKSILILFVSENYGTYLCLKNHRFSPVPNKYEYGDKVKIKSWKQIKEQEKHQVDNEAEFSKQLEEICQKHNRIFTIQQVCCGGYNFVEEGRSILWEYKWIECLVEEGTKPNEKPTEPYNNRYELMDI